MEKKGCLDPCSHFYYSGKRNSKPSTNKCHQAVEIAFFIFAILASILSSVWLYCWSVLNNIRLNIYEFLFEMLNVSIPVFLCVLVPSVVVHVYVLSVVSCAFIRILFDHNLYMSLLHKCCIVFSCLFYITSFVVLDFIWPDNSQWNSIAVSLEITSPFLQICSLVCWVLLFIYFAFLSHKIFNLLLKLILSAVYISFLIFLLSIPFWLYSPCIGKSADDLMKPKLFGHRGAPTLAPENTIFSCQKAVECGVYGLESDVRISRDGVAFLMHDDTLLRTTNVKDVFPSRQNGRPESFTWSELRQLNAGDWFLNNNPFKQSTIQEDVSAISIQKIPSFVDWVSFAATHNMTILFDVFSPPVNHLNYSNYLRGVLRLLLDSDIPQSNVIWPVGFPGDSHHVKTLAPNVRLMSYDAVENPQAFQIDFFNFPYEETTENTILQYNVSVIEYVIDTSLAFSRAWCQGAWAVTSNYACFLSSMTSPSWLLTTAQFYGIWITIEILSLLTIGFFFYFTHKRLQAQEKQNVSEICHDEMTTHSLIIRSFSGCE